MQTGVELANVKMSMNPFCEIALEVRLKGRSTSKPALGCMRAHALRYHRLVVYCGVLGVILHSTPYSQLCLHLHSYTCILTASVYALHVIGFKHSALREKE